MKHIQKWIKLFNTLIHINIKWFISQLPDSSMGQLLRSVTESMISMKDLLRKLDDTVTKYDWIPVTVDNLNWFRLTVTIKNHYKAISNITKQCQQSFMSPYRKVRMSLSSILSLYLFSV